MEPRPDEKKDQQPQPEAQPVKPRRFRVVKLEERIAPAGKTVSLYGGWACYTIHAKLCK
jgi:hypothetical protein